ncbi:hypothetical protein [Actinomadura parmotrematis]|uniref:Uncharacterized protein n=1 Tax=Actinomadura parmotrematis TaxID=2864039 RepID=A0ABS7FY45_9ACTN|nr:hypothetical protein [Actinomadura parmotrematis]MBW8484373.1 hypothetical protein [Actinomadura parmotrematis]
MALPTDPAALVAELRRQGGPGMGGGRAGTLRTLNTILRDAVPPPKVQAAIFRAMHALPGATLGTGAEDDAGRPALAVGWTTEGWLHEEVLLDPRTYAYLGERAVAIKRHVARGEDGTRVIPRGTLQRLLVRVRTAVVDRAGQRP